MTDPATADQRRAKVQTSLNLAHAAFHDLLGSLTEDQLAQRSATGWAAREVATHLVTSVERVPALIEALRHGRDYLNIPTPIFERLKHMQVWWAARHVSWIMLRDRLDAAYPPIYALVRTIGDDEWGRSGRAYGEGHWTVESALTHQLAHTEEHISQIRELIRRRP